MLAITKERYSRLVERSRPAAVVALVYVFVGAIWIIAADRALSFLIADPQFLPLALTISRVTFVGLSAAILYVFLLRKRLLVDAALLTDLETSIRQALSIHEALSDSESRLRHVIDSALDSIVTIDPDGVIVDWNAAAERTFGWTREEAIGEELATLLVPERYRAAHRAGLRRLAEGEPGKILGQRIEMFALNKTGREVPVELAVTPVSWASGTLYTGFIRDIEDRVRASREAQHIAAIVAAANDAIIGLDTAGTVVSWNRAAAALYGYDGDDIQGSDVARLFASDQQDNVRSVHDAIRWGVRSDGVAADHVHRDGSRISVVMSVAPLSAGEPSGAALVVRDVTEQQALHTRLADAEYLAGLGQLAGTVAHEFNNVLMGIQPFLDVLSRTQDERMKQLALSRMQLSVQRGRQITEEILHFTRAAAPPNLEPLAPQPWFEVLASEIAELVGSSISVSLDVDADGLAIIADSSKLAQVFTNLALNARDAMPAGGTLSIRVRSAPAPRGKPEGSHWLEVTVSDTGAGMSPDVVQRLFDPLFTTKPRGTGLGLAVAQQVVHQHGGTISVESAPGEGATFRLLLAATISPPVDSSDVPSEVTITPRRVLLIEDDPLVAGGIHDSLIAVGMHVDVIHHGARAIDAVGAFHPDVVVLDIGLPDVDGVEVFRRIDGAFPLLPVIFSTGHGDELRLADVLAQPGRGFLRKPYSIKELMIEIERVAPQSGGRSAA